jgi:hypothetical protein
MDYSIIRLAYYHRRISKTWESVIAEPKCSTMLIIEPAIRHDPVRVCLSQILTVSLFVRFIFMPSSYRLLGLTSGHNQRGLFTWTYSLFAPSLPHAQIIATSSISYQITINQKGPHYAISKIIQLLHSSHVEIFLCFQTLAIYVLLSKRLISPQYKSTDRPTVLHILFFSAFLQLSKNFL